MKNLIVDDMQMMKLKISPDFKDYQKALQMYWRQDYKETIEFLSSSIEANPNHTYRRQFYRLWIEVLSEEGELDSLALLQRHIYSVFEYEDESSEQKCDFLALNGFCHLEMNNIDAARFALMACEERQKESFYCAEFLYHYTNRKTGEFSPQILEEYLIPVADYFYLLNLSSCYLQQKNFPGLNDLLIYATKFFDGAPLIPYFSFHISFESGDFVTALNFAEKLLRITPHHTDYLLYKAYCLEKMSQYDLALNSYKKMLTMSKSENTLEGEFMLKYANQDFSMHSNHEGDDESEIRQNCWLMTLNSTQYFNLLDENVSPGHEFKVNLGKDAKVGDLVIAAYKKGSGDIKLISAFDVSVEPTWGPYSGYETTISLKTKIQPAIEMEVEDMQASQGRPVQKPKYGYFMLDDSAIAQITTKFNEYIDEGYSFNYDLGSWLEGMSRSS